MMRASSIKSIIISHAIMQCIPPVRLPPLGCVCPPNEPCERLHVEEGEEPEHSQRRTTDGGRTAAISALRPLPLALATATADRRRRRYQYQPPLRLPLDAAAVSSTPFIMFKDMVNKQVLELKKLWANKRQLTFQLLNLAMIVFSALMIWKGLMFATRVS